MYAVLFDRSLMRNRNERIMTDKHTTARDTVSGEIQARPKVADAKNPGRVSKDWSNDHVVNIRITIPFLVDSYYLTLVAGAERRSPERRAEERRKHPLLTIGNVSVMAILALCIWFYVRMLWNSIVSIAN